MEPVETVKYGYRVSSAMGCTGIVRFIGNTHFSEKICIGIVLDRFSPNAHNGRIHGHLYYECTEGHGLFLEKDEVFKFVNESSNPWVDLRNTGSKWRGTM